MPSINARTFLVFSLILLFVNILNARPIDLILSDDDSPQEANDRDLIDDQSTLHEAQSILEKLKRGDPLAWKIYGPDIVNILEEMVKNGQASDPFDALLIFFYPNSTPEDRREIMSQFRPLLESLLKLHSMDQPSEIEEEGDEQGDANGQIIDLLSTIDQDQLADDDYTDEELARRLGY